MNRRTFTSLLPFLAATPILGKRVAHAKKQLYVHLVLQDEFGNLFESSGKYIKFAEDGKSDESVMVQIEQTCTVVGIIIRKSSEPNSQIYSIDYKDRTVVKGDSVLIHTISMDKMPENL